MEAKVEKAYEMAKRAHEGQKRKCSGEDYIHHPLQVWRLVSFYTDDEDVQCAALLHDAVEDTKLTYRDIRRELGERVANIVEEVSTSKKDKKTLSWKKRKENTILSVYSLSKEAQLVEVADKVSNAKDFDYLLDEYGRIHFNGFKEKDPTEQEWYYRSLYESFLRNAKSRGVLELTDELGKCIDYGFGRSYESYLATRKSVSNYFDFFRLRTLFKQNKEKSPVCFEIVGTCGVDTEELASDMVLSLQKYGIESKVASCYESSLKTMSAKDVLRDIKKIKDNEKADVIFVTRGIEKKKEEILNHFYEEKKENPVCVYHVVEELDALKEGQNSLIDGVIGIYEYHHFSRSELDSYIECSELDSYIERCDNLKVSLASISDSVTIQCIAENDVIKQGIPFVLETSKSVLENRVEPIDNIVKCKK